METTSVQQVLSVVGHEKKPQLKGEAEKKSRCVQESKEKKVFVF